MSERNDSLKGVSYSSSSSRGLPELTFRPAVPDPDHRSRQAQALCAIGEADNAGAKKLRDQIQSLHLLGTDSRWIWGKVRRDAVDLHTVEGLSALRELSVSNCSDLIIGDVLPPIERLNLREVSASSLPGSPTLKVLVIESGTLSRLDLRTYPALEKLVVHCTGALALFGLQQSSITELTLRSPTTFDGLPEALRGLNIQLSGGASADLSKLVHLRDLELHQDGGALPAMPPGRALGHLRLFGADDLDLSTLSVLGAPRIVSIADMRNLSSLRGLPCPRTLALRNLPRLREVALAGPLTDLRVDQCGLRDFDAVGEMPALSQVAGSHNEHLVSLAGLSRLSGLRQLSFHGCKKLANFDGLVACPLERVELYHCSREATLDLLPLDGLTTLTRLRLTRTRVSKASIPKSLHGVVIPKSLVARRKRSGSDKPLPTQARGVARKQVAKLKKLMFSRDLDRMDQCADLVGALGVIEVATALGGGSKLQRGVPTDTLMPKSSGVPEGFAGTYDRLVPNRYFESGPFIRTYREHGLRALVARVPEDSELAPMRDAEGLLLTGRTKRWERAPVRVWPLAAFPRLARVGIYAASAIEDIETLAECAALEELAFWHVDGLGDVASVCLPPTLKRLVFGRCELSGLGRGDTRGIESLAFDTWFRSSFHVDPRELRGFVALRHLDCGNDSLDPDAISVLASLRHFDTLSLTGHQGKLEGYGDLASIGLRRLLVDSWAGIDLRGFGAFEELEDLTLRHFSKPDLSPLGALGLKRLELQHCSFVSGFFGLRDSSIEELVLRDCHRMSYARMATIPEMSSLKRFVDLSRKTPKTLVRALQERGIEVAQST